MRNSALWAVSKDLGHYFADFGSMGRYGGARLQGFLNYAVAGFGVAGLRLVGFQASLCGFSA